MTVNRGGRPPLPDGTRRLHPQGFWRVRVDGEWRLESREVMAALIGRPLRAGEEVRFTNGDSTDASPENLELWVRLRVDLAAVPAFDAVADAATLGGASQGIWTVPKTPCGSDTDLDHVPPELREAHLAYRRIYMREWRAGRTGS